ncbi:MAG: toxin-antitoxin system YwqK family antitoxin [Woeseiaceae bacterium]
MKLAIPYLAGLLLLSLAVTNWFAVMLVAPQPAETPDIVRAGDIRIDTATGVRLYRNEPFTGTAVTHHASGTLARSETYVAGRRQGELQMWFSNGQIAYTAHYEKGRRIGLATSWWRNGNRRSETRYVDDRADGVSWHWYRTGEKYKRFSFANGVPTGLQKAWRLNGKLYSNFEYRNGRAYGLRNANLCVELEDEELPLPTT